MSPSEGKTPQRKAPYEDEINMTGTGTVRAALILAFSLTGLSVSMAQPRNGNVQNGLNYQPTQGEVGERERAAGVAPSTERERALDAEMEEINRQLLRNEGVMPNNTPQGATHR
jgi:hypothetical protein